jgi:hypothetical protein
MAALFLALCLRLLAPTGWMPASDGHGIVMVLCSGSSTQQTVVVDLDKPAKPDTADKHAAPCAFSSMGTPALAGLPPALAIPLLLLFIGSGLAQRPASSSTGTVRLRPPLRGPPLLV